MAESVMIGGRVSEEVAADLQALAEATGRSKSWLVAQAVSAYVRSEREFLDAVAEGLDDLAAGRTVTHEQVAAEIAERFSARK